MEEKKFRSLSIRAAVVEEVEEFIQKHPDFIRQYPEFNSVAGFMYQATRSKLQELKRTLNGEPIKKLADVEV